MYNRKTTIGVGSKKVELGVSFNQFHTLEEAIETFGKEKVLQLVNAAHQMDQLEEIENRYANR